MTKHRNYNSIHSVNKTQSRRSASDSDRRTLTSPSHCYSNSRSDSSEIEEESDNTDVSDSNKHDETNVESKWRPSSVNLENAAILNVHSETSVCVNQDLEANDDVRTKNQNGVCYSALKQQVSVEESLSRSRHSSSRTSISNKSICDTPETEVEGFTWRKLTRDQIVVLVSTCLSSLVSYLSLSIIAPFFPLEADKKNVNSTISGWIFGVYALVQFVASPFFGHIMPKVGSRFMYVSGLFICGGCTFLFGLLDRVDTSEDITLFVSLCLVTRILLALGSTGLNNAGFVFIIKYFPDNIATIFGIAEVFTGIGMVTGPALGGFLYSAGGFILPFTVVSACCFIALPFVWFFIPEQDDSPTADESGISLREVILHPRSIVNSIVVVVSTTVWSVLDPTLEPHLRVYGLGPELVGLLFLVMAAFYSVTAPIWGRVADCLPDNRVLLIPGLIISATGLLLIGPSPALGFELSYNKLWLTIVSLVLLGIGCSMSSIPSFDVYIDVLEDLGYPDSTRTFGMVSSLWMSMYALGDFTGPIMGGFLFDEIGFEWLVSWIAGACVLTSLLVAITWYCEGHCCKIRSFDLDSVKDNEIEPLLHSWSNTDALNTYPPGSTIGSQPLNV